MQAPIKNKSLMSLGNGLNIVDDVKSDVENGPVTKKVCHILHLSCYYIQLLAGKTR
jgi:hypothetical protein